MSAGSGMAKSKFGSKLESTGMGAIMEDEDDAAAPEVALEIVSFVEHHTTIMELTFF
jgi:hypothetical protein